MGELAIRRNRGFTVPRYQVKTEKQTGSSRSQGVAKAPGFTISETLRQLMTRVSQAESHSRESRRTLQRGEAALAEVQDGLERMSELARSAAGDMNTPVDATVVGIVDDQDIDAGVLG